ncbi:MAG: DMT family transporter [Clostridia bacterium]|nr:DMT family transporter [Clostridia bacterium]
MIVGLLSGLTWAVETVLMGIVLGMSPFFTTAQAMLLAPFAATFLHDLFSAVSLFIYNGVRGKTKDFFKILKKPGCKWLVLGATIGGPIGMTGYTMAVNYMGASVGSVATAVYPAIGTVLAFLFLKEKVKWYQWVFLFLTLLGVYGLSYSPDLNVTNFWLGLLGAFMCAFGWGTSTVILAKCLKDPDMDESFVLTLRQSVSALVYGVIILPVLGAWKFIPTLFTVKEPLLIPVLIGSALAATVSYLMYYVSLDKIGAAKTMALNVTYPAWAIILTVIFFGDTSMLNPLSILCTLVVVVCGVLAACDMKQLFGRKKQ